MSWLAIGVISALINLLMGEFFGWFPWLATRLIRGASGRLPTDLRARYEDEWLAELEALPSQGVVSLLFAFRIVVRAPTVKRVVLGTVPTRSVSLATKRVLDFVASTFTWFLLAPVIGLAAVAVKLSSKGPVLIGAERVGRNGKIFRQLSFRTTHKVIYSADALAASVTVTHVTSVGRVLHYTNLDVLPMLINVVKGEMSLVGPSPMSPVIAHRAAQEVRSYRARPNIKPGITGLAQLRALRDRITLAERIALDNHYIAHRSFILDIKILMRTAINVLRGLDVEDQQR